MSKNKAQKATKEPTKEPKTPKTKEPKHPILITFSVEHAAALAKAAERCEISRSEFIRAAAIAHAAKECPDLFGPAEVE